MQTSMTIRPHIDLPGYTFRPARLEDVPAMHALLVATDQADDRTQAGALEDMQSQFDDPWSPPEASTLLVFAEQGELAAFARVYINPEPVSEIWADGNDEVHPAHRGRGLEDALIDWFEAVASHRLAEAVAAAGPRPQLLRLFARSTSAERIARYERRGYRPVRHFYRMRRDLSQPLPEAPPLPDGLRVSAFSPEYSEAARLTIDDSFSQHWGYAPFTPDEWRMFVIGTAGFRPDLTRLLLHGDQVVGASINQVRAAGNARSGLAEGLIDKLGVLADWRKRGLATYLLVQSMRAFAADGLTHATLGVDADNASALKLYERVGFETIRQTTVYEKTLSQE
jgi:mycothiol synthase